MNNTAREDILGRVRRALAVAPRPRTESEPPWSAPEPTWSRPELRGRFLRALEAARASHQILPHADALAAAVARYLEQHALTGPLALAPHPQSAALAQVLPQAATAAADTDCSAALTVACAGLADTGTLVLASGPDTPTRLALLPDHLLVVLDERHLLPGLPALWAALPRLVTELPRALNLVTGPSRTADIEQTITLGAHGARALHVLLLTQD